MWRAHFLHFHHGSSGRSSSFICSVSCNVQRQRLCAQRIYGHETKVKKLLCNIYRRDVSVDYRLQDLHPFCQVLSVDKFQREVVLGRQISHKADFDCYEITTEGPSTQELHFNGVASTPPDWPRSTLASWVRPLPGRGRTGFWRSVSVRAQSQRSGRGPAGQSGLSAWAWRCAWQPPEVHVLLVSYICLTHSSCHLLHNVKTVIILGWLTHSFSRAGKGRARCRAILLCCRTADRSQSCPRWSSTC